MIVDPILFFISLALGVLTGYLLGWDAAVRNHRKTRRALEKSVNDLENEIAEFQLKMLHDPQRAWIDLGKRNVLHQLERAVLAIRASLEPKR